MKNKSIKHKLVVSIVSIVTLIWLVSSAISAYIIHDEVNEVLDDGLAENAKRLVSLNFENKTFSGGTKEVQDAPDIARAENELYFLYQIRNKAGEVLIYSHSLAKRPFSDDLVAGFQNMYDFRIYTESIQNGAFFVQVAEPLEHRNEAVLDSVWGLILPLLIVIPITGFMVWWLISQSLAPLLKLNNEIIERSSDDLNDFDVDNQPAELLPITSSLNNWMKKISQAIFAEREFASNSAHELRTPIASILAQIQRLLTLCDDHEIKRRVLEIEGGLKRLQGLTVKLLQLSRADASALRSGEQTNVLDTLSLLVDDYTRSIGMVFSLKYNQQNLQELDWPIDVDATAIILRNLIENAMKYGTPGQSIEIYSDDEHALHIVNKSEILSKDKVLRLTNRFERGDHKSEGAGLGLAIVDTFVKHGAGQLKIHSPALNQNDGFEVVITFA